jgi:hypothetical protein
MEPKSRLRLRPMVSLLRQGFPSLLLVKAVEVTLLFHHWQLLRQAQVCGCASASYY